MPQPPDTHPVTLESGDILYVPDRYGPEETTRLQNEYNRIDAANASSGVPGGELSYPEPDPSQSDTPGTWLDKNIRAGIRGTAGGVFKGVDFLGNALQDVNEIVRNKPMSEHTTPAHDWFESWAAPTPEGSTYQSVQDYAEVYGPVVAAEIASLGVGTPEAEAYLASLGPIRGSLGKLGSAALNVPLKSAAVVQSSKVGGAVGGGVGEMIAGDRGKTLGELFGSVALPAVAAPLAHKAISDVTTTADSAANLATIRRLNANLKPAEQIQPTIGMIGSAPIAAMEDAFGRSPFGAKPIIDARRSLFAGVEKSGINAFEQARGRGTGQPMPSTGPISMETLGRESDFMAQKAIAKAEAEKSQIQEDLRANVGAGTKVDPSHVYAALEPITQNPTEVGPRQLQHADQFIKNFEETMAKQPVTVAPGTQTPLPYTGGTPIREDPTYGAVTGFRSDLGKQIDAGGRPLDVGVKKMTYGGATEAMREAAQSRGVTNFDPLQARTEKLYGDIEKMEPVTKAKTETAAGMELFGGQKRNSLEQLAPYGEHVPETLAPIMANALELRMREGNAGRPVDPNNFDIESFGEHWRKADPDYQAEYTGRLPEPKQTLDDASALAMMEANRSGKRTAPGKTGSTMNTPSVQNVLANTAGALSLGGLGHWLESPATMIGSTILAGSPIINYAAARAFKSPTVINALVNPGNLIARAIRRAGEAITAEGATRSQTLQRTEQEKWDAEQVAPYTR